MAADPIDIAAAVLRLRTLANPARLRIVLALLAGEQSVAALEAGLALRQPNLSQHLAELRDAGLLAARRESRAVFYRLAGDEPRRLVLGLLHGFGGVAPPPVAPVPAPVPPARQRPVEAAVFATVGGGPG